ncbi:hypothetical protein AA12717_2033 [Gluconacetobacter sacchari DSM 12717]|uniref:Insertion element IS402-like domain-containing protein n=1 Tax=Gluconacetobacter sacchari DSM 12717 TaxID=1307940 RepID=A0ABQ0P7B3_9PROT|nr:hypothetical protein AA12717_2033 [Gluconacetobacter sacchari DSM 12717]
MYVLSTGCQWRAVQKDLPQRSTVYDYFDLWTWDRTIDRIHHALYVACRERNEIVDRAERTARFLRLICLRDGYPSNPSSADFAIGWGSRQHKRRRPSDSLPTDTLD